MKNNVLRIQEENKDDAVLSFLQHDGQVLLPLLKMVEACRITVDELIDRAGMAMIEMVLHLSAESIAGTKQRGQVGGDVYWHGSQGGVVRLKERKVQVKRPRLRRKTQGQGAEVEIPAYAVMQKDAVGERMLEILLKGVSTRKYEPVLPALAETVGVKKSSVSRQAIRASEALLKRFSERRWDGMDFLVIYLDGVHAGDYHVVAALGVDRLGCKHVLGLKEGATENQVVVKALLEDLVERGVDPSKKTLFVIDGAKALRKAIKQVFGEAHPVQRCRLHKMRNVMGYLPEEQRDKTRWVMKAAFKLDADKGVKKLEEHAAWLEKTHPEAAKSLREGLEELFTINRMDLSLSLRRCLSSTNIIENPNSAMRQRTRNVKRWRDGAMVLRWMAAAYVDAEKTFRKIQGYKDLWMLEAALREDSRKSLDSRKEAL